MLIQLSMIYKLILSVLLLLVVDVLSKHRNVACTPKRLLKNW